MHPYLGFHRDAPSLAQIMHLPEFSMSFLNSDGDNASNDYSDVLKKKLPFHDGPILRTVHS